MSSAKRHHYVPQFYLRRFADAHGRLRVYRAHSTQASFLTSVKDAAVKSGFYKIETTGHGNPMQLEAELSKIEGDASAAIGRVASAHSWPPSSQDRNVLATYMALQRVRTPEHRREVAMMTDTTEKVFFENMTPEWAKQRLIEIGATPTETRIAELMDIRQQPRQLCVRAPSQPISSGDDSSRAANRPGASRKVLVAWH